MPEREIYVARLRRLPLHGPDGIPLGRIDDVVISPSGPRDAPRVLGFVVSVQRRAIFVNAARVGEIDSSGARLASGRLDVRRFERRPGEILAGDILDRTFGGEVVNDLAIRPVEGELRQWEVASVSLSAAGLLRRRRAGRIVRWTEVRALFDAGPLARHVAALRDLHPADVAEAIAALSPEGRRELAAAMEDDRLADLLEELPEEEQLELISTLGVERIADILEEMEPDDAADLLGEMGPDERATVLEAMEPDDAGPILRLLSYDENTAGGL
ncbi:MAG TPA: hypothetical protein VHN98_03705, partial [Acidimicrobiales bacterium]|nr:hypothetical protein [Acidimicrobiales bacterium]